MRLRVTAAYLLSALTLGAAPIAGAQETTMSNAATAVNVFLDCSFFCDQDFIRTEINYVNWVRDRAVADVHVLVTSQQTGGGGTEYTLAFLGLRTFAATGDTLRYVAPQASTPDVVRRGLTRTLKVGLVRYLARTALADRITVSLAPATATGATPTGQTVKDPWNNWIFTISASGSTDGERSSEFSSISGGLTARRVTNDWKVNLSVRESYNESKFRFDDQTTTSVRRSYTFTPLVVKSLGPKLSIGLTGQAGSSTFENKKFYYRILPALEYDIFPYSESTRRSFTAQYAIGIEGDSYIEETIFLKTRETLPTHTLSFSLSQTQPWGSVNVGLSGGQFLNMTSKNEASIFAGTNIRILKGLSFSLSGSFQSIHDRLSISRSGATEEEVLLRQKQLETNYSYFAFMSLNYTFGSIFNNVVNPRFGGSGGSMFFFF